MRSEEEKKKTEKERMEKLKAFSEIIEKHWYIYFFACMTVILCFLFTAFEPIVRFIDKNVKSDDVSFFLSMSSLVFVGVIVFCLPFLAGQIYKKWDAKQREIRKEEMRLSPRFFYEQCKSAGCDGSFSPADLARLRLVAEKNGLPTSDAEVKERFCAGKNVVDAEKRQKQEQTEREEKCQLLAKLSVEEREVVDKNTCYMEFGGRDKRIKICKDHVDFWLQELNKHEKELAQTGKDAELVYRSLAQKEGDWGLLGGAASGLAGGAAGLAVAMDVQRKNTEISSQNAQLAKDVAAMSLLVGQGRQEKCASIRKQWSSWENALHNAENMLVEFLPQDQLLDALHPELIEDVKVSPTGAVRVRVKVQPGALNIYESVPAIVDGFFRADLHLEGEKVGEAVFGLWLEEEAKDYKNKKEAVLEGVCLRPIKAAQSYDVTFSPIKLWGVEKK